MNAPATQGLPLSGLSIPDALTLIRMLSALASDDPHLLAALSDERFWPARLEKLAEEAGLIELSDENCYLTGQGRATISFLVGAFNAVN